MTQLRQCTCSVGVAVVVMVGWAAQSTLIWAVLTVPPSTVTALAVISAVISATGHCMAPNCHCIAQEKKASKSPGVRSLNVTSHTPWCLRYVQVVSVCLSCSFHRRIHAWAGLQTRTKQTVRPCYLPDPGQGLAPYCTDSDSDSQEQRNEHGHYCSATHTRIAMYRLPLVRTLTAVGRGGVAVYECRGYLSKAIN